MKTVVVCQSTAHALQLIQGLGVPASDLTFVAESVTLERAVKRLGGNVVRGRVGDRAVYRELLPAKLLVIFLQDHRRLRTVLEAIRKERADTPVLALSIVPLESIRFDPAKYPWAQIVPVGLRLQDALEVDVRLAKAKIWVRKLREIFAESKRALILLQDDPDPDGLACGLALRTLLGRNRKSMPMGAFGKVTRPENLEMLRVLDLTVDHVQPEELSEYDRLILVDTQPPHLKHPIERVDAVIDHHPVQTSYDARYKDVRNSYGATATILVEYLRSEGVKVNERLATALLYAIRTDTLLLDRPVATADVEAFTWLFPKANTNWIRRIERPALPRQTLVAFADGLKSARIEDKVIFSHLGHIEREDIVPQLADFCLQVEDCDWSVVSGVIDGVLSMSIRNVGFVQKAGALVKAAFGELGSAGGHRSMAKAVLPLENVASSQGSDLTADEYRALEDRFLAALRGEPAKEAAAKSG